MTRMFHGDAVRLRDIPHASTAIEHEISIKAVPFQPVRHPMRIEEPVKLVDMGGVGEYVNQIIRQQRECFRSEGAVPATPRQPNGRKR
jgi:hypothetical protein